MAREITTPSLPAFITSCLSQVTVRKGRGALLSTVLEAFCELLPHHPNAFRPFVAPTKSLAVPLLAATPSSLSVNQGMLGPGYTVSASLAYTAQRLFVLLHYCAPKNASGEDWAHSIGQVIENTHETADQVLRALIEDWESSMRPAKRESNSKALGDVVGNVEIGPLDLPGWQGIYGGLERIVGLLNMIQTYLATGTASAVAIPIGRLLDLSNRLLLIRSPVRTKSGDVGTRINPEIGRDEREGLWNGIPRVRLAVIEFLAILVIRCDDAFAASSHGVLEQVVDMMVTQRPESETRSACYALIQQLLQRFGPSLTPNMAPLLSEAIVICCEDLLAPDEDRAVGENIDTSGPRTIHGDSLGTGNADSYLRHSRSNHTPRHYNQDTQDAAAALLLTVLTRLPSGFLSFSMRSQIERAAILTQHEWMMFASAVHPFTNNGGQTALSSTLPIFARAFPDSLEAEALLRPQMPVLRSKNHVNGDHDSETGENIDFAASATRVMNYGTPSDNTRAAQGRETFLRSVDDAIDAEDATSRQGHSNMVPQISQRTTEPLTSHYYTFPAETNKRPWGSFSEGSNIKAASIVDIADEDPVSKRIRMDRDLAARGTDKTARLLSGEDARPLWTDKSVIEVPAAATEMASGMVEMTGTLSDDDDESDFEIPPLVLASDTDDEGDDDEDDMEA